MTAPVTTRKAHGGTLVLGGGFAGSYVARLLGKPGTTIVSPENFMLYTPMLPEAASGTLEPRHVVVPLRVMCPHAELLLGHATAVDEDARRVRIVAQGGESELEYDNLVVALGAVARTLPIPGLAEHALGFKNLADAIHLRNHVLRELEAAAAETDPERVRAHLTFVFVGAGYAGVEALAELSDLVRDALRYYPGLRGAEQRWVLVDAAPSILPEIPRRLGEYAAKQLASRGVDIRVSTTLESVDAEEAVLSGGTRLATHTLVWTAGVKAQPLLAELGLPLDDRGRVVVGPTLQVEGRENIWALGDCARVPNAATSEHPDPPTCQHALRQARRSRRTCVASASPTATGCSGRSRPWAATGGSPTSSGFACAASRAGSSRGPTTSSSSPSSRAS
jgi:NADH dehydrogenase